MDVNSYNLSNDLFLLFLQNNICFRPVFHIHDVDVQNNYLYQLGLFPLTFVQRFLALPYMYPIQKNRQSFLIHKVYLVLSNTFLLFFSNYNFLYTYYEREFRIRLRSRYGNLRLKSYTSFLVFLAVQFGFLLSRPLSRPIKPAYLPSLTPLP